MLSRARSDGKARQRLVVPALVVFEVFNKFLRLRSEEDALRAVAGIQQGKTVDLTADL
jgi:hypothetical protein